MLLVPLICLPLRNLVSRNAWNIMLLCIHLSSCFLWLIPRFFKIISKWFLFQVFPNACFAWVKDADHLLHIEKPNEFNGTIINFLESWFGTKKKTRTKIQWRICSILFDCCNIGLQSSDHKTLKTNRLNIVLMTFSNLSEKFSSFSVLLFKALE